MHGNTIVYSVILAVLAVQIQDVSAQRCPLYWYGYGQSCYRYDFKDYKTWFEAKNYCRSQGGDLLKIETAQEKTWVTNTVKNLQTHQHARNTWWVGLNNLNPTNAWEWADNSPLDSRVAFWLPGNPNNRGQREHCARIENYKLNDRPCGEKISFICERSRGTPLLCDADRGWQSYSPYCYKVHGDQQNWARAKTQCRRDGGDLVTISSTTDESTMQNFARNFKRPYWIGLHTFQTGSAVTWVWSNGSALSPNINYWPNNRAPTVPNNRKNNTCVYVSNTINNNRPWQATTCSTRKYYTCQKPQGVCQDGWVPHQRLCYQMNIRFKYTWQQAVNYCNSQGARLLEYYRSSDTAFINSYLTELREAGIDSFWIGATDHNGTSFSWSRNGRIQYQNWQHNPPVNTRNKVDCSYVSTSDRQGKWRTTSNCVIMKKAFICDIGMNVAVRRVTTPRPRFTCPHNWILYGSNCYRFNDQRKTWLAAQADCHKNSATLAKVTDAHVQGFLISHSHNQEYWIGLNDQAQEGRWLWSSDGSVSHYFHWNKGEPNNRGDENCAELRGRGWNDKACTTRIKYICEKVAQNAVLPTGPVSTTYVPYSVKCGLLWQEDPNSNFCYQFHDEQLDWVDARSTCQQQGGDLLSIASREEQFYVAGRITQMSSIGLWIGANDRSSEGGWRWSDGSPFRYLNWASGEPDDNRHHEDCAMLVTSTAKWDDYSCSGRNGYICKKTGRGTSPTVPSTTVHLPAGMVLGCPNYWKPNGNYCYQFLSNSVPWAQARTICRQHGGYLATISTQEEQNYIVSQIPRGKTNYYGYWIGLNDQLVQNNFQWSDGSPVTFTAWSPKEPNNWHGHPEDCVIVLQQGGKWNDAPCGDPAQGIICKRPKQAVSKTQSPETVGCTLPARGYESHCYFFANSGLRSWAAANKDCANRFNGSLATINDRYTQAFLANYLNYHGDKYWIGMSDTVTTGTYLWQDNSTVKFTFWHNTHTGNEVNTCVALRTALPIGLWENEACNRSHHYICQYPRAGYTTPVPTIPTQPPPCPTGWTASSSTSPTCYMAFYNDPVVGKKLWEEARDFCRALGGDLASIHNAAENNFILSQLLSSKKGSFWIGLNDRDTENGYVWTDGTPSDFTYWGKGEPNNYKDVEDCVQVQTYTNFWNDQNCFFGSNFICAVRRGTTLGTTAATPTGAASTVCGADPGWLLYNNTCYLFSPSSGDSSTVSWHDANQYCITAGAQLASVHSLDENNFIIGTITKRSSYSAWIGYNELGSATFSWTDGSADDFENWNQGEPNNYNDGEQCVQIAGSGWNDHNCGILFPFVCKKRIGQAPPSPQPTTLTVGGCPNNFSPMPNSNKCYRILGNNAPLNYSQAVTQCQSFGQGYDLASIVSINEQAFVTSILKGQRTNIWIGFHNRYHQKYFVWQDNSPVHFTNWASGEPNGHSDQGYAWSRPNSVESCVEMYVTSGQVGKWNDKKCLTQRPYLCETARVANSPVKSTQGYCRNGYQSYGTSCYKVVTAATTWSNAKTACANDAATLAIINDIYEDSYVFSIAGSQGYWIGLSDSGTQTIDSYKWLLNWPVWYTNWGAGEPTRGAGEGCVAVTGGMWNDTLCTAQMSYVCEINSVQPPPPTQPPPGHCADSTQFLNGDYCYFIDPFHSKTWPEARYMCERIGMDLASIHSNAELQMLYKKAINMQAPTNDKTVASGVLNLWIGMNKGLSDGFAWVDNSPVNYVNWATGEPSDAIGSSNEECVEMYRASGQWNDKTCFNGNGYICKGRAIVPTTPIQMVTQTPLPTQRPQTQGPVITPQPSNPNVNPTHNIPGFPPINPPIVTNNPNNNPGNPFQTPIPQRTNPPIRTYAPPGQHQQQRAPPQGTSSSGELSGGAVAGIVIAVLIVLAVAAVAAVFVRRRGGFNGRPSDSQGFDNALYSKSQQSVNIDPTRNSMSSGLPGEDDA